MWKVDELAQPICHARARARNTKSHASKINLDRSNNIRVKQITKGSADILCVSSGL